MNLKEDNFYKALKDSIAQLPEAEPTVADWESFKLAQAREKNKKKRPFWLYILLTTTISVLAASSFLWNLSNNNKLVEPKEVNKGIEPNLYVTTNLKTIEKQSNKNLKPINFNKKHHPKLKESKNIKEEIKTSEVNNNSASTYEIKTEQTKVKDALINNWKILTMSNNQNKLRELAVIEINARNFSPNKPELMLQTPKISSLLTPNIAKRPLKADWISASLIPIITNTETNTINGGIGIKLGKDFGKGWQYSFGVEISQISMNKTLFWNRDFERNELVKIDTTLKMNANFTKIIMVMDSVYEKRTHTENVVKQHNITSRNIDLPLEIGYQIQVRKLSIGGTLGVFNRITHTQMSFTETYPLSREDTRSYTEKYSYQLLGSMGITLGYPVSNRLWVQATPNVLFNTIDRNRTETRLRMGIMYYLN